jgi:hypothetical protein
MLPGSNDAGRAAARDRDDRHSRLPAFAHADGPIRFELPCKHRIVLAIDAQPKHLTGAGA